MATEGYGITKYCSFKNCINNSTNSSVLFHSFRKRNLEKWLQLCNNPNLRTLSENTLLRHRFVCSNHFQKDDYTRILEPFNNRLKKDAIPSLNLCKYLDFTTTINIILVASLFIHLPSYLFQQIERQSLLSPVSGCHR